jgi:hypothetical protein
VAIRSLRPYATEEAFLAEERDTLTRTAITLIGAPSRPRGVVIRFELTLNDGAPLVRGEGRVLGYQPSDEHGPSSLTLRFTRLDARSKALVDRAAELREAAAARESEIALSVSADTEPPPAEPAAEASPPASAPDPMASTSLDLSSATEPPPPSEEPIAVSISSGRLPLVEVEEIGTAGTERPPPAAALAGEDAAKRDSLLDRLRVRAKTLSPTQVATILAVPRPPT